MTIQKLFYPFQSYMTEEQKKQFNETVEEEKL